MCEFELIDMDIHQVAALVEREQASSRWPWSQKLLTTSLEAGHDCLLIVVENVTAGYCVLMDNGEALELLNLIVFTERRRRGVGRRVIEAVCARARTAGRKGVWLEVREDNLAAIAFYHSCGFIEQGRRANYYTAGAGKSNTDAILLEKKTEAG